MNENFGAQLKALRERLRVSARDVSHETRIPLQFIEAFENWDLTRLGALVYVRGFFKKYTAFLGISAADADAAFAGVWAQTGAAPAAEALQRIGMTRSRKVFDRKTFVVIGITVLLLFVSAYLFYSLKGTLLPPRLDIRYPASDMVTEVPAIDVDGAVDPETNLLISGRPIYIDEKGNFKERVLLSAGINALEFEVKNKFGKILKVNRYVLLK